MTESDVSSILQPLHTEEYYPAPRTELQRHAAHDAAELGADSSRRVGISPRRYSQSSRGTAASLLSLNAAAGDRYFDVPEQAALDDQAAAEAFASDGPVIDVQTHFVSDLPSLQERSKVTLSMYRSYSPDWWHGLDNMTAYNIAEYLRCIFGESETALAVISSAPGNTEGDMILSNTEMAGLRELFDRTAGSGRLLNHTVVRPNVGDIECMPEWASTYRPVGWKVYTLGMLSEKYLGFEPGQEWRLDDENTGIPFLEQARATGVKLVCAHKGISGLVAAGSPSDVGPAAKAFPDINFVIYHSGYEIGQEEGPYGNEGTSQGIDRLISTVLGNGLGPGCNVYAELGTTWFNLICRPHDAAHVLGKLLLHLGEDNIIWGTDAIWYGPTQPLLDAFRAFQIPDAMCERFGYPKLTPEVKRKILAGNAARAYGIDLAALSQSVEDDQSVLGWIRAILDEHDHHGLER